MARAVVMGAVLALLGCAAEGEPAVSPDGGAGQEETSGLADTAGEPAVAEPPADAAGGQSSDLAEAGSGDAAGISGDVPPPETEVEPDAPPARPCEGGCDDGDVCTVDACDPTTGCLHLQTSCADDQACTWDVCDPVEGCVHIFVDCDDGDTCTADYCLGGGECKNEAPNCDDKDACTADSCRNGECTHAAIDCEDGDPCTLETCDAKNGCMPDLGKKLCCEQGIDCNDGSECTVDLCTKGKCEYVLAETPGCCFDAGDCDDENPCTEDSCTELQCVNKPLVGGGCCAVPGDCDDGVACTEESCADAHCASDWICCVENNDCDDGDPCTTAVCVGGTCIPLGTGAPGCCDPAVPLAGFEAESGGAFALDPPVQGVGWHLVEGAKAFGGSGALYYGNPGALNYSTPGKANKGDAAGPPFSLAPGVTTSLLFAVWLQTEAGTYADRLLVFVDRLEGGAVKQSTLVWTKKNFWTFGKWVDIKVDISAWAGQTVRLRFSFDTFDAQGNEQEGVYIDEIRLESACSPRTCEESDECNDKLGSTLDTCLGDYCIYSINPENCLVQADCDDKNPCTSDVCGEYQCVHTDFGWCCNTDEQCADKFSCTIDKCLKTVATPFCSHLWQSKCCDYAPNGVLIGCDDGKPCTEDICPEPGGTCEFVADPDCCTKDSDCTDAEACTGDVCLQGKCNNLNLCCEADASCDDGDDLCTAEHCEDGTCTYELVNLPGCCKQDLLVETFDGAPVNFTLKASAAKPKTGLVTWQQSMTQSHSAPASMWFGNPATGTYEWPGYATSGILDLVVDLRPPVLAFTQLSLWVYLGVEYAFGAYPNADFDRLQVLAQPLKENKTPDGAPALLWDSAWGDPVWWEVGPGGSPAGPKWTQLEGLDLTPFAGRLVRIVIAFDTKDSHANGYPGVFVDDVVVQRTCGTAAPPAAEVEPR